MPKWIYRKTKGVEGGGGSKGSGGGSMPKERLQMARLKRQQLIKTGGQGKLKHFEKEMFAMPILGLGVANRIGDLRRYDEEKQKVLRKKKK